MKKLRILLILVVLFIVALPVSNLVVGYPENRLTEMKTGDAERDRAAHVLGRKCANCHSSEPSLPFYAHLPPARGMVEADMAQGTDAVDFLAELTREGPVSEVAIAKTERVLADGTMPPRKYLLLHWNGGLDDEEETLLGDWIRSVRTENYATGTASEEFAAYVVQPLPDEVELDPAEVALGRELYHDVRLSKDDTISCASCHGLDEGGCDREKVATGVESQLGPINSPTVLNAGFQFAQFWDGRAATLEEQAAGPVNNPIEMGSNWPLVLEKLGKDEAFLARFREVYPEGPTPETIVSAIAAFERSLVTPDSPVDLYLKGDEEALTPEAEEGFRRFEELGCATCHVGKLLGGQSFEKMGRRGDYFADRGDEIRDVDRGRYNVTEADRDMHRFKVPTLRNVALTYPYFHDASTSDLAEAVGVMARYELGRSLDAKETASLVAFLEALTGKLDGEPLK